MSKSPKNTDVSTFSVCAGSRSGKTSPRSESRCVRGTFLNVRDDEREATSTSENLYRNAQIKQAKGGSVSPNFERKRSLSRSSSRRPQEDLLLKVRPSSQVYVEKLGSNKELLPRRTDSNSAFTNVRNTDAFDEEIQPVSRKGCITPISVPGECNLPPNESLVINETIKRAVNPNEPNLTPVEYSLHGRKFVVDDKQNKRHAMSHEAQLLALSNPQSMNEVFSDDTGCKHSSAYSFWPSLSRSTKIKAPKFKEEENHVARKPPTPPFTQEHKQMLTSQSIQELKRSRSTPDSIKQINLSVSQFKLLESIIEQRLLPLAKTQEEVKLKSPNDIAIKKRKGNKSPKRKASANLDSEIESPNIDVKNLKLRKGSPEIDDLIVRKRLNITKTKPRVEKQKAKTSNKKIQQASVRTPKWVTPDEVSPNLNDELFALQSPHVLPKESVSDEQVRGRSLHKRRSDTNKQSGSRKNSATSRATSNGERSPSCVKLKRLQTKASRLRQRSSARNEKCRKSKSSDPHVFRAKPFPGAKSYVKAVICNQTEPSRRKLEHREENIYLEESKIFDQKELKHQKPMSQTSKASIKSCNWKPKLQRPGLGSKEAPVPATPSAGPSQADSELLKKIYKWRPRSLRPGLSSNSPPYTIDKPQSSSSHGNRANFSTKNTEVKKDDDRTTLIASSVSQGDMLQITEAEAGAPGSLAFTTRARLQNHKTFTNKLLSRLNREKDEHGSRFKTGWLYLPQRNNRRQSMKSKVSECLLYYFPYVFSNILSIDERSQAASNTASFESVHTMECSTEGTMVKKDDRWAFPLLPNCEPIALDSSTGVLLLSICIIIPFLSVFIGDLLAYLSEIYADPIYIFLRQTGQLPY